MPSEKFQSTLQKEINRLILFAVVMLIIKVFPPFFSFSGTSLLYEKYYENVLPISVPNVIIILYVVRFVFVIIYQYWQEKKRRKRAFRIEDY